MQRHRTELSTEFPISGRLEQVVKDGRREKRKERGLQTHMDKKKEKNPGNHFLGLTLSPEVITDQLKLLRQKPIPSLTWKLFLSC
ncbi:hypothetical protein NDU88_003620 [Pleurodeles waltl]|uniref:Uncharacterized protein n=1 Tax=Pleurodeles waltl TaxID=8319 RepID=A0AAV7NHG1_PLEWA|nr:hypothetical protein NDU88_003620 [Pleurodeles waltl]